MARGTFIALISIISVFLTSSCDHLKEANNQTSFTIKEAKAAAAKYDEPHPYGGWFCPDNFGFAPVDIQELDKVPVVADRLPTKEETSNGSALMYFDKEEYPDARPLDMELPRVAKIYSSHNDMLELIIVIQAAVVGDDTIVGYRFPNGGNGSAWLGQVSFLSTKEVEDLGPSPFVYLKSEFVGSRENVWKAFTKTAYAKKLGEKFDKKAFFESDWTNDSQAHLSYESDEGRASGIVTMMWGNLYLHIDYDYNGFHYSEKMLVSENTDMKIAELHIAAGPYPEDFEKQEEDWKAWLDEIKGLVKGR